MSYSKPEQMNDQEFYISVLQVKCLSIIKQLKGHDQSQAQKGVKIKDIETGKQKRQVYREVGQHFSDLNLLLIFGLAFLESSKYF